VIPNDDLIFSIIGDKKILWQEIAGYLRENQTDITDSWRYYNDGKCWLCRVLKKNKTLFWIGIIEGTFRVTFWLSDKAVPLIEQSDLPAKIKNDFENSKKYNLIRGLSIIIEDQSDVESVKKLIGIKLKIK